MTDFADFWAIAKSWRRPYGNPRKGRGGAETAWERCIQDGADPDEMVMGAEGFAEHIEQERVEPQKVCMAATFLNQWRFEQYADMAREIQADRAEALIKRRRTYYRHGRQDFLNGNDHRTDITVPEVQEAYDMGWRDTEEKAAPKLELVI